jgi:hypothetical protein
MADGYNLFAQGFEGVADLAGGLTFANVGANGGNGHNGLLGLDHGARAHKAEICASSSSDGGLFHDGGMRNVTVREYHLLYLVLLDQFGELRLGVNGDTVGIELSCQFAGYTRPSISGIWVAVKATTW